MDTTYTLTINRWLPLTNGDNIEASKRGVGLTQGASTIFLGGSDPLALAEFAKALVERHEILALLEADPWGKRPYHPHHPEDRCESTCFD